MCITRDDLEKALDRHSASIKEHFTDKLAPVVEKQKEHHETLYDANSGLCVRVQRMENYGKMAVWVGGFALTAIGGAVARWDKIKGWFSAKLG